MQDYPKLNVTARIDSRGIAVDDEQDADVGSLLFREGIHLGASTFVGKVVHLRGHATRPGWSVLILDRPIEHVYVGDAVACRQKLKLAGE